MKAVELFAGGGGLALGLHAGFEPVAVVERDTDSCETLRENWHHAMGSELQLFDEDVRNVDFRPWQNRVGFLSLDFQLES